MALLRSMTSLDQSQPGDKAEGGICGDANARLRVEGSCSMDTQSWSAEP